jgi:hypothetical protein
MYAFLDVGAEKCIIYLAVHETFDRWTGRLKEFLCASFVICNPGMKNVCFRNTYIKCNCRIDTFLCATSGFRLGVRDILALLGCYNT